MIASGEVAVAAPPRRWHIVEFEEEPELDGSVAQLPVASAAPAVQPGRGL